MQYIEIFFLFFPENRFLCFMQIVSNAGNLHEISNPISGKNKKNIINLSTAEFATHLTVQLLIAVRVLSLFS